MGTRNSFIEITGKKSRFHQGTAFHLSAFSIMTLDSDHTEAIYVQFFLDFI